MITAKTILLLLLQTNTLEITPQPADFPQIFCMAKNVYYEARSEHISGKNAVAHVTLNRTKDKRYPTSICGVVKQANMRTDIPHLPIRNKCAFSWYCDGLSDKVDFYYPDGTINQLEVDAFTQSAQISLMAIYGITGDPTNGATHYYNYNLVSPYWASYYTKTVVIEQHVFSRREYNSPH